MRLTLTLLCLCSTVAAAADLPGLKVDGSRRYLETTDGAPFFYLADTAWELFHRLDRDEAIAYLDDRAEKGFNVVQPVALAELGGLTVANPYGHLPLIDGDPTRPDVRPGPENDYWDHVDFVIDAAAERGIYTALLPTWGSHWQVAPWQKRNNKRTPLGLVFNSDNARTYGRWIATRYRDRPVIWVLGGDRDIVTDADEAVTDAMAAGIGEVVGDSQLITYHPSGAGRPYHERLFANEWLDFMMVQSGHGRCVDNGGLIATNRARSPAKPVVDGEPNYEDITRGFNLKHGRFDDREVRRAAWRAVLSGAAGHTYGHNAVWQMHDGGPDGRFAATRSWREALDRPGADDMRHLRDFAERNDWTEWKPRPDAVTEDDVPACETAACVAAGESLILYISTRRAVTVRDATLADGPIDVEYFDVRTGSKRSATVNAEPDGSVRIAPPDGEAVDWVAVITSRRNSERGL
ncbi:MAG: DUF4038 domain-containing protein [Planctomycetota bacterium]